MIRRRSAVIFDDKSPDEIMDLVNRLNECGIRFELRADLKFGEQSFWASNEAIFIFDNDRDRSKFLLVECGENID